MRRAYFALKFLPVPFILSTTNFYLEVGALDV